MMNNQNNQQRVSGFYCPVCKGFIPVSIIQLINSAELICPQCTLAIRINPEDSKDAVEALKKVQRAENQVKEASVFRR